MEPLTQTSRCSCSPGWFLLDDGAGPIPACVCPMLAEFATELYWLLPSTRRAAFEGIEKALCGTRTRDDDELARRLMIIYGAAQRAGVGDKWLALRQETLMLDRVHDRRYDSDFDSWACRAAEACRAKIAEGGPVAAWLAMDALSDLLVSSEVQR